MKHLQKRFSVLLLRDARSTKHGIDIVGRPSVRASVCLSVTLMYRGRIGWVTSKVIARIIRLWSSPLGATIDPGAAVTKPPPPVILLQVGYATESQPVA